MLLGPYLTMNAAINACSGSSSSCVTVDCEVDVNLVGECGLELSDGIIYSIGTQIVSVSSFTDDCECVLSILVNGFSVPYSATDGEVLTVTLLLNDGCFYDSVDTPACVLPLFGTKQVVGSKVRMRLLPENISKYLLARRRAAAVSGKLLK